MERLTCAILVLAGTLLIGAGIIAEAIVWAAGRFPSTPNAVFIGAGIVIAAIGLFGLFFMAIRALNKKH